MDHENSAILVKPIPSVGSATSSSASFSSVESPYSKMEEGSSDLDSSSRRCKVCDAKAHGSHFQAITCRACAAFFRRTCQDKRVYKCRRATKNCEVSKNAPYKCRFCRYEKCKKAGMRFHSHFSPNTELPSDVSPPDTATTVTPRIQRPHTDDAVVEVVARSLQFTCPPSVQIRIEGADNLNQNLLSIFNAGIRSYGPSLGAFRMTTMQRIQLAFDDLFAAPTRLPAHMVEVKAVRSFDDVAKFCMESYVRTAKFLMSFPQFACLSLSDKVAIFQRSTNLVCGLSQFYPTVRIFGLDKTDRRLYIDSTVVDGKIEGTAIHVDHFFFTGPVDMMPEINRCFHQLNQTAMTKVITPMRDLQITEYELVFLKILLCWNIQSLANVSEAAKEIATQVVEEVSNEIHNYYMVELRALNYASRLVKLMSLQISVEEYGVVAKRLKQMGGLKEMLDCDLLSST